MTDHITKILVDDYGGLRNRYSEALQFSPSDCRAMEWVMLTQELLESDKFISDPVLRDWYFCDYSDHKSSLNLKSPPDAQFCTRSFGVPSFGIQPFGIVVAIAIAAAIITAAATTTAAATITTTTALIIKHGNNKFHAVYTKPTGLAIAT
ncbi:hypothetical protein C1645_813051 [Glomus cerebriforme]|uniref:Uncharacterized protein n=1 Tax=Glomus cerebriforme TaxID=658196 RepID=A0A397TJR7_9GLOM|nr:hypothetical protein C1645_813051 [Glomus cerebriforme]